MNTITRKMLIKQQPKYTRFMLANLINRFGDSIDQIATMWLVYSVTGKASLSALVYACNTLPSILFTPFIGVWVEKLNKKFVIVSVDVMRAILVLCYLVGFLTHSLNAPIILLITFTISTIEAFGSPAVTSFIPSILDEEYFEIGIGTNRSLSSIMELIGVAAAGSILATFGIAGAFLIDIVTFLLAALLKASIPYQHKISKTIQNAPYLPMLKEGFTYLRKSDLLIFICFVACFMNASLVPFNSLLSPYVAQYMNQKVIFVSIFSSAVSIGVIVGGFLMPKVMKLFPTRYIMASSALLEIIVYGAFGINALFFQSSIVGVLLIVLSIFLLGCSASIVNGALSVIFMKRIPHDLLARTDAIFTALCMAGIPLTSFAISFIVSKVDIPYVFLGFACICILCSVIILSNRILDED